MAGTSNTIFFDSPASAGKDARMAAMVKYLGSDPGICKGSHNERLRDDERYPEGDSLAVARFKRATRLCRRALKRTKIQPVKGEAESCKGQYDKDRKETLQGSQLGQPRTANTDGHQNKGQGAACGGAERGQSSRED